AKSSDEGGDCEIGPPESAWPWWADDLGSDDELGVLAGLSGRGLVEDEVDETLAQMGKGRQETWTENRDLKNAVEKVRGYWTRRRRRTPAQLKLSRRAGGAAFSFDGSGFIRAEQGENLNGSSWTTLLGEEALRVLRGQCFGKSEEDSNDQKILAFLALEDGCAIADSGASQAIMGKRSLDCFAEGLKPRRRAGAAMIPVATGGKSGVIEFVVAKDSPPPLLPGEFLNSFGAMLDYLWGQFIMQKIGPTVPMRMSGRGHRATRLNEWRALESQFEPPEHL
ncbi:unnamed protein product, partial [Prorocentrum cordatum]